MTKLNLVGYPNLEFHEVVLVTGAAVIKPGFKDVLFCVITEKAAVCSGDEYSWDWTKPDLDVDSDNGASTATLSVLIGGHK